MVYVVSRHCRTLLRCPLSSSSTNLSPVKGFQASSAIFNRQHMTSVQGVQKKEGFDALAAMSILIGDSQVQLSASQASRASGSGMDAMKLMMGDMHTHSSISATTMRSSSFDAMDLMLGNMQE